MSKQTVLATHQRPRPADTDYDVIIVGFGAAGVSAAIEAAEAGAQVLVLDRGYGGGATALSGGIVYAGGGTRVQTGAAVEDDPDNMFRYLHQEVRGAVSDETLRAFCESSPEMIDWLEGNGATFDSSLAPYKTSYPTDRHYLYYSGNEKAHPFKEVATPAPRGHRQVAKGLDSGKVLFTRLRDRALQLGVHFLPHSKVDELILENGSVVGVRYRTADSAALGLRHPHRSILAAKLGNWAPAIGARLAARLDREWAAVAASREARAGSVILAGGGFVRNRTWMARWSGPYANIAPLGTPADDGSAIALGLSAGGTTDYMDRMTAWRFITPTSAMTEGIIVDGAGARIANEDLYGATFSDHMVREHGAVGYLVLDAKQWRKARRQIFTQANTFQLLQLAYLYTIGHKKAHDLASLAQKIGVPPEALQATTTAYNSGILTGQGDPAHKAAELSTTILSGPYFAIDVSVRNSPFYPAPGLTLGGLKVNERTGHVLDGDGRSIDGLYAAGRTAVGICAVGYISGLSIADCLFSGRRAGRTAAATAEVITNA
ncbi:FAD-binding protein [Microbacterium oleivorans]|uniref:FAD-binding protein n=1 Tax=Microbacterium oleivorans TaxID=273677 RepID=A0A4R5YL49_9MICO|nr:FAD-binding protein [Microbacterium oleivorans]TDL45272.1 FAD-binding protein [Microbacterium oleivorans]